MTMVPTQTQGHRPAILTQSIRVSMYFKGTAQPVAVSKSKKHISQSMAYALFLRTGMCGSHGYKVSTITCSHKPKDIYYLAQVKWVQDPTN